MKKLPADIYSKVERIAQVVYADFKNKGLVVPTRDSDGSVRFDRYTVKKQPTGFYSVEDITGYTYATDINLPQTAAVIANDLALGRILDNRLLDLDRNYGYKIFDRDLFKRNYQKKKITADQLIYYKTRMEDAGRRAEYFKSIINRSFNKLSNIA